ncbi:MAG TPA: SpoIIE family protein phosphatase, partial [Bacteroidia bacterium]|nr:SpoIIE family protein phosphatase [Bacteroidia bacterium]
DAALKHFILADSIGEKINDKYLIEASLDALSGICYTEKNYKSAIDYTNRLIAYGKKADDIFTLAAEYGNMGNIVGAMGDKKAALGWYFLAVKCYGEKGKIQLPQQYANIGQTYFELGMYDSSLYYSRLGLTYSSQQNSQAEIARCYQNIGGSLYHQQQLDSALWYVNVALGMATAGKAVDIELSCHDLLSEIYEAKNDLPHALEHSREYARLTDSINAAADAALRNEMLARFDSQKKEEDIALQKKDIDSLNAQREKDRLILWIVAVSALLVLLLIFVAYQIKRKANVKLEAQNKEILLQKDEIATKNKEITDSINYAKRIQDAALPDLEILRKSCHGFFILNRPRDIVSGDFHWISVKGKRTYIAVADCTGHGVPGALVSVIGIGLLNQIVDSDPQISTGDLLNRLHNDLVKALNKNIELRETSDGMDIALACIDADKNTLEYSGAVRPLYYVSGDEFRIVKGERSSIGSDIPVGALNFSTTTLKRNEIEMMYLFSDGYADQFGSEKGKKFLIKRFHDLLGKISKKSPEGQREILETEFDRWKGKLEQVDDVLVLGVKL